MEILISTFILSLIMLGLMSVFISAKKLIYHSRSRLQAGELGRVFLEPLQFQVRQDTWGASCLASQGNCTNSTINTTTSGLDKNYTGNYTSRLNSPIFNLTSVTINIAWNESDVPQ